MKSFRYTLPSTDPENITSTCWWFQTAKASSTTFSVGTCPLSSPVARIINIVHQCTVLPLLLPRGASDCSSPAWLFRPSRAESGVPLTRWSGEKYQKVQSRCKNSPCAICSLCRLRGIPRVPAEESKESASNTKVRQLHKPSGFGCHRVSQVPELNGVLFTAKIRWPSFSSILKIRTAMSEESCQTWNRWRL